jgi:hypothetical protein
MPSLTRQEEQTIIGKYQSQRVRLRDEISNREKAVDSEQRSVITRCASMKKSLATQIRNAEASIALELRAITADFANRYSKFDRDAQTASDQLLRDLSALELQAGEATRICTGVQWRMGKLQRERRTFDNVTFKAFIKRTFIWR